MPRRVRVRATRPSEAMPAWFWQFFLSGAEPAEGEPGHEEYMAGFLDTMMAPCEQRSATERQWSSWREAALARWSRENPGRRPPIGGGEAA